MRQKFGKILDEVKKLVKSIAFKLMCPMVVKQNGKIQIKNSKTIS